MIKSTNPALRAMTTILAHNCRNAAVFSTPAGVTDTHLRNHKAGGLQFIPEDGDYASAGCAIIAPEPEDGLRTIFPLSIGGSHSVARLRKNTAQYDCG
jgi:hypothetical protein